MVVLVVFGIIFILVLAFSTNKNKEPSAAQIAAQTTVGLVFGLPLALAALFLFISVGLDHPWVWFVVIGGGIVYVCWNIYKAFSTPNPNDEIINNMKINGEQPLKNSKIELLNSYSPLSDNVKIDQVTDLMRLRDTEKYLLEMIAAHRKYNDFFSNVDSAWDSVIKGFYRVKEERSASEIEALEKQLIIVQDRINTLGN